MNAVLATIVNCDNVEVARFVATSARNDLLIDLQIDAPEWCYVLATLQEHRTYLLANGTICVSVQEPADFTDPRHFALAEQQIGHLSNGQLRLAYEPEGVEQALTLHEQIARQQPCSRTLLDLERTLELIRAKHLHATSSQAAV